MNRERNAMCVGIVLLLVGIQGGCVTMGECQAICIGIYEAEDTACIAGDPEDVTNCRNDAAEDFEICYNVICEFSPNPTAPDYELFVDVDWASVDPFNVEEGDEIEVIAVDVDTSDGYDEVFGALPFGDVFNGTAWATFHTNYVFSSLQSSRDNGKFYYASLEDVLEMTPAQWIDTTSAAWTFIGLDSDDSDGLSVDFDTTGLDSDWYVVRAYLYDSTPTSRIGFGFVHVQDPD